MSAFLANDDHLRLLVQAASWSRGNDRLSWYAGNVRKLLAEGGMDAVRAAHRQALPGEEDALMRMLYAENERSVSYRYSDEPADDLPGITEERSRAVANGFDFAPAFRVVCPGGVNTVEVLKALDCYEYQSCEHPEWEESEARAFCEALRRKMIRRLPGYSDAPWEWSNPEPVRRLA